ncbi:MAG: hypothetical protein RMK84_15460 [Oscillochloridaceae bacterium]|nr:hypothetical protein [Chloroflexaceae bacterium]MDW8391521.1 hypothetical protein [Oscillochloridaceae bacterium]
MDDDRYRLDLPFQFNAASHGEAAARCKAVRLTYLHSPNAERTATQQEFFVHADPALLDQPGALPGTFPFREKWLAYAPDEHARSLTAINGEPLFRSVLYLFNVIVALEWQPSAATYQQIRVAMQRASDFLYDVTNGYMAFGQIVIGGPALLDGADIQVLASNRVHPRAWHNGWHEDRKFKGIRVGRGIWQKDLGLLSTWDTPEGYRALIHEWGHYALNINDEYLEDTILVQRRRERRWRVSERASKGATAVRAALPRVALPVDASLMAATQISELPPWQAIFETLRANFPLLPADDPRDQHPMEGPLALPLPLPVFVELPATRYRSGVGINLEQAQEVYLDLARPLAQVAGGSARRADAAHWLYVLKPRGEDGMPGGLIAQGKVSAADQREGFHLLGAEAGDELLLISQVQDVLRVQRAAYVAPTTSPAPGRRAPAQLAWSEATPPGLDRPFFVDVLPQALEGAARDPAAVAARIEAHGRKPDAVQIYPCGPHGPLAPLALHHLDAATLITEARPVPHLDGHVLLRWPGDAFFVVSYSQGGGPNSTTGGRLPISAGSAEGNAMLFFVTPENRRPVLPSAPDAPPDDDERVRIVTTTLIGGPQRLPEGAEARSYVFSLASNVSLMDYSATLVLYYDRDARERRGDLVIYRWDSQEQRWVRHVTYAPVLPYVALPLQKGLGTAPALTGEGEALPVERYRIYRTPGG